MDFNNIDAVLDSGAKLGGGATFAYLAFRLARYALDWLERKLGHDAARIEALEVKLIPLAEKAALADHLEAENGRLLAEKAALQGEIVQKDTSIRATMDLMKYLMDPRVQKVLREVRIEEEKANGG